MSLYDKPSSGKVSSKIAITFVSGSKFQISELLLLGYLVLTTLVDNIPTLGYIFSENDPLKYPPIIVSTVTSIGLAVILSAFGFGLIRAKWPLYLVAVFSVISITNLLSAEAVTTTYSHVENYSYLQSLDMFHWFGNLDSLPLNTLIYLGISYRDLAIEGQRLVLLTNASAPLLLFGLWLYFQKETKNQIGNLEQ